METFYRNLGTTPQEVGNGVVSQPVIAGTLIGVLLALGAALALYALMFIAYTYWSAFRDDRRVAGSRRAGRHRPAWRRHAVDDDRCLMLLGSNDEWSCVSI